MRMGHIVICSVPRFTIIFPHNLIKRKIFEKIVEPKVCVSIHSTTLSDTFLILRRNITKPYICLHVQYRIFLSDFNKACISATYFGNNNQILNSMKTRSVRAELFCEKRRTDGRKDGGAAGQTDRHDKANCRSSQFFEHA